MVTTNFELTNINVFNCKEPNGMIFLDVNFT